MHRLISETREMRALARELDQLNAAQRKDTDRRMRAAQEHADAVTRWQEQVRAAQLAGAVPPETPVATVVPGDPYVFHGERTRLRQLERDLLAEHADDYEGALAEREGELLAEVRQLTSRLDAMAAELGDLATTAQALRAVSGTPTPVYAGSLTTAALVAIVQRGARPLSYGPSFGGYVDARPSAL